MTETDILPANEKERIKALKRYEILDTPPDGSFDRITTIAAKLFNVPIALVTLVDEDRIWFKAKHGLENVNQIDRDPGLCSSAILSPEVYYISDTLNDPRTLTNPLVAGEFGLRFYAAAPLRTKEGYNLGTVCLLDTKPKNLSKEDVKILEELAGIVMDEMELRLAALKATRQLKAHKENLEIEIKQRTEELTISNKELTRSNLDLEQFAYISSHDLKEPLRMVSMYAQLFSEKYARKLDEDGKEYLAYLMEGAERMEALINDVLNYSRVGRENNGRQDIALNEVVGNSIKNLQTLIEKNQAEITVGELPVVNAISSQMMQLFQNLIENAIKFRRDENPKININAVKEDDKWLFSVADNGIGIDPVYEDKIFQLFQRLHTREQYPGTGIGLAICKKIVEQYNGKIWVESKVGEGTTFYFTLPVFEPSIN
ncbi:MAG: GAF domain-containing sensor histidine kinase [Bacteroidia bacterium]